MLKKDVPDASKRLEPEIMSGEMNHAWLFVADEPDIAQRQLAAFDFTDRLHIIDDRIYILNPFGGDNIKLLTKRVYEEESTLVGVLPTVIFDSNMIGLLVAVTKEPANVDAANRLAAVHLIETLLAWNCAFSPLPYLIERSAKDRLDVAGHYAWRAMMAYVALVTLDAEYFRATGLVKPDDRQLDVLEDRYGYRDAERLAASMLATLDLPYATGLNYFVEIYYATLLKLVLINKFDLVNESFEARLIAFEEYIEANAEVPIARALIIARFYLAGLNPDWLRLVPVQKSMPWARAQSILRATAWDLYLASLCEQMAGWSQEPVCETAMFCTREKSLARALRSVTIEAISVTASKFQIRPELGIREPELRSWLGVEYAAFASRQQVWWSTMLANLKQPPSVDTLVRRFKASIVESEARLQQLLP